MPIQVNELIIRTIIDSGGGRERTPSTTEHVDKTQIVEECVEQVLEILKDKQER